ncbi:hypothetical protein ACJJI3_02340 [Microbulbifer sp. ZKSA004]|uniref:hypothetical protein n=1 Tax=Microbulbifer sp. ZKSA004 TaxID=3243389 RepID=UPI0040393B97
MLDLEPGEESRSSVDMTPIDGISGYMDYDLSVLRDLYYLDPERGRQLSKGSALRLRFT